MTDLIFEYDHWIKAVHIMAVISWMAGIFYLPRLFVHHTEKVKLNSETDALFQMMEEKLFANAHQYMSSWTLPQLVLLPDEHDVRSSTCFFQS